VTLVTCTRLSEPSGLRHALARDPGAGDLADRVASALASAWWEELAYAGVDLPALRVAAHGYTRELRLWVVGERRWAPTAEALFARAVRRRAA
jgi:hypothetical protein